MKTVNFGLWSLLLSAIIVSLISVMQITHNVMQCVCFVHSWTAIRFQAVWTVEDWVAWKGWKASEVSKQRTRASR